MVGRPSVGDDVFCADLELEQGPTLGFLETEILIEYSIFSVLAAQIFP